MLVFARHGVISTPKCTTTYATFCATWCFFLHQNERQRMSVFARHGVFFHPIRQRDFRLRRPAIRPYGLVP
jgi:hypothetical protein